MLVLISIVAVIWISFIISNSLGNRRYARLKRVCYKNRYGLVDHKIRQYRREFGMTFVYRY
jgi:hypothetical protein